MRKHSAKAAVQNIDLTKTGTSTSLFSLCRWREDRYSRTWARVVTLVRQEQTEAHADLLVQIDRLDGDPMTLSVKGGGMQL